MIFSSSDTLVLNARSAWAASTDSKKLSVPGATGGIVNGTEWSPESVVCVDVRVDHVEQ